MSIGESLADARHQAGLTVTQVSRQTRIREAIIRDIEQDDFSSSGGDFYARGHIRSIASAVGADPGPLISEYDAEHGPLGSIRAADVFEPSRPVKIRDRRGPSLSMIVGVVLLAIIGFGAYRLYLHRHTSHPVAASSSRPTAGATPTAHHSASPSAKASPSPSDVVIHLTANQDCWVLLTKRSDGSQIYMGVIPAGSSKTWTEKQAVTMQLGNPPGIVLSVNGKILSTNVNNPETLNFSPHSS
ncbi:MAG: DUF4115 domain-containing protein [Actinobacteria bacterium]|nr:DUF4115 domain-containing protein [Actinomycetota bacterium]